MNENLTPNPGRLFFWPEITALLLIVMETSWLMPWYRGVSKISYVTTQLRAGLVLGGMMLVAYLLTRLFDSLRLLKNVQHILMVVVFVVSILLSTRLLLNPADPSVLRGLIKLDLGAVLVVIVGLWMWWRGIGLARTMISPQMVWRRFWFSLIMLVVYMLIFDRVTQVSPDILPFFLFLASGLLALVIARVAYISEAQGSRKNPLGRSWLATIGVSVAGFVGLAMLLASLLTGQFSRLLEQLTVVGRWILVGILFLASLPGLIFSVFLFPLLSMIRNALPAPIDLPVITPQLPYPEVTPTVQPVLPQLDQSYVLLQTILTVLFWSVVLLLVLIYFAKTRRGNFRTRYKNYEDPESLLDRDALLRQMRKSLSRQARQLFDGLTNRLRGRRHYAEHLVRQIYAQLLDLAEEINQPRANSSTPLEFLPVLELEMPDLSAELELITRAYVRVRYGEIPETPAELEALRSAWQRIEAQADQLKKQAGKTLHLAEIEAKNRQNQERE